MVGVVEVFFMLGVTRMIVVYLGDVSVLGFGDRDGECLGNRVFIFRGFVEMFLWLILSKYELIRGSFFVFLCY